MKLIIKLAICFFSLVITAYIFPNFVSSSGGILGLLAGAAVLWIINLLLKPLLQLICLPVTMLTFGLCYFAANALLVGLTDAILPVIDFKGYWVCLFAALLICLGNWLLIASRKPSQDN